ncbi:MAG TPA: BamA/TamA family outer membrane protein [Polyangia bacterium]|jgi:hypothetical protein
MRSFILAGVGLGLSLCAAGVRADAPASAPASPRAPASAPALAAPSPPAPLPPPSAAPGATRPIPRYDGREPPPPTVGEVLLWGPRLLLLPLHLTLEYLLRRPLVALLGLVEQHHLDEYVKRAFVWRDGQAGIFPTFLYELGLSPAVGLYAFYHDLGPGLDMHLNGVVWNRIAQARLGATLDLSDGRAANLAWNITYRQRPDQLFFGLGPASLDANASHYWQRLVTADVGPSVAIGDLGGFRLRAAYSHASFANGEPTGIESVFDVANPSVVPGFLTGYGLFSTEALLALDSRSRHRQDPGSGLRLELTGAYAIDPGRAALQFFRWGGTLSGYLDLSRRNQVLSLVLYTSFVEPIGSAPVPFTELPALGGVDYMRGFNTRRFVSDSAITAMLDYIYPIWDNVAADLFVEAGNAFGPHLSGFALERLHLDWGLGFRTRSRTAAFDVRLAFGTNRLDSANIGVEHVAVFVGLSHY